MRGGPQPTPESTPVILLPLGVGLDWGGSSGSAAVELKASLILSIELVTFGLFSLMIH
jgi:hypothetical protein